MIAPAPPVAQNDPRNLMPGDRVIVFDNLLYRNDLITPPTYTHRSATIIKRYGQRADFYPISKLWLGPYPDMIDVVFDHRPDRISHGHFTKWVKSI